MIVFRILTTHIHLQKGEGGWSPRCIVVIVLHAAITMETTMETTGIDEKGKGVYPDHEAVECYFYLPM